MREKKKKKKGPNVKSLLAPEEKLILFFDFFTSRSEVRVSHNVAPLEVENVQVCFWDGLVVFI